MRNEVTGVRHIIVGSMSRGAVEWAAIRFL